MVRRSPPSSHLQPARQEPGADDGVSEDVVAAIGELYGGRCYRADDRAVLALVPGIHGGTYPPTTQWNT